MRGMDGMELAWVLKRLRAAPAVVFVTRYPERAAEAFDLGAVDYLSKPARPDRLVESLRRAAAVRDAARPPRAPTTPDTGSAEAAAVDADDEAIPVELCGTTKLVPRSTVRWVQAEGDYARLHTTNGSYLIRARTTALADCWQSAGLVRIHRSYLVRLRSITQLRVADSGALTVVVDGQQLPVSRRMAPMLRSQLITHRAAAR